MDATPAPAPAPTRPDPTHSRADAALPQRRRSHLQYLKFFFDSIFILATQGHLQLLLL